MQQLTVEQDRKLRAFIDHVDEGLKEPGKDYEFQHDLWFWNDSTDSWLYDTGMIQHFGDTVSFFDQDSWKVFMFDEDAVAVIEKEIADKILRLDLVYRE